MFHIQICQDTEECASIWERVWPKSCLFDLWQVRNCFASSYKREPYFIIIEEGNRVEGLLAMSWIDELRYFAHFPGETWKGKTWLEQNRIIASSTEIFSELVNSIPGPAHLRYLVADSISVNNMSLAVDEMGYLFYPGDYGYSFEKYMQEFSGKSRKKLARELAVMEDMGVAYRYDLIDDIWKLFRINLEFFGESSYFFEPSFLDSFEKLAVWLHQKNMLKITTLLVKGVVAAIDIGAIWKNTYTLLAGATNPEFPGVAKMINFHHIKWSCRERLDAVDFLCGDFSWKNRFHLFARPLFELSIQPEIEAGCHISSLPETFQEQ